MSPLEKDIRIRKFMDDTDNTLHLKYTTLELLMSVITKIQNLGYTFVMGCTYGLPLRYTVSLFNVNQPFNMFTNDKNFKTFSGALIEVILNYINYEPIKQLDGIQDT